jgi:hypothetical protein
LSPQGVFSFLSLPDEAFNLQLEKVTKIILSHNLSPKTLLKQVVFLIHSHKHLVLDQTRCLHKGFFLFIYHATIASASLKPNQNHV